MSTHEDGAPGGARLDGVLDRILERVLTDLLARLEEQTSAFADPIARRQLEGQVRVALQDTLTALGVDDPGGSPADHTFDELIGRERAGHQVHPSESLTAVNELFDLAYPAILETCPGTDPRELGRALHHSIMQRLVPAAIGYVDVLLNQVHEAQLQSRLKLAQDLHDRIAHGVGVGLQGIQLATLLLPDDRDAAVARLSRTERHLAETLDMVREMSGTLREAVGRRTLEQALREYLDSTVGTTIAYTVITTGDLARLPQFATEETYLILREAARNVLLHAPGATSLSITLDVREHGLRARLVDDGDGFDPAEHEDSTGLQSMHERARLIRGSLSVVSGRGRGTEVQLDVPVSAVLVS